MAKSYKDLVVWQKAMDLSVAVYQVTKSFPKEELFGMVSQMRRAAVSIASNIAEGEGRKSKNEFAHFVSIAMGSKAELETQVTLCERVGLCSDTESQNLLSMLDEIGKMLASLKTRLSATSKPLTTNH
ncbi:four helix bundle protein [Fibrobacter sp. UWH9]|uniref:four helix bundle protein n=1 Tax=Fibrobacter sp. UWH9 TaxID=1896213 RepID=UPI0009126CC1|nr:four helix bundle protein [Fibrobacter sp. UWH9]SHH51664.1 four helix bundle protein [Fibrobacter sp. UWH9]